MKMRILRRKAKQFLALVLVFAVALSSQMQALAASQSGGRFQTFLKTQEQMEKEEDEAWRKSSPLYNRLIGTNGKPNKSGMSLSKEPEDWVKQYEEKVEEEGINETLNAVKDAAKDKIKHLWRGSPRYKDAKKVLNNVADFIENVGSVLGVVDAMSKFSEMLNLQGDTVGEQLMELTILTAQFGIAAFSVIGMSIGFPWGMILSLVLEMILGLIQSGILDGIIPSGGSSNDNNLERQRYKLPDGSNVYKPNIYIYSKEEREVEVSFEEPELLTVTIPEYQNGWRVTADAAGRLTDAAGVAYDYLFYESVTEPSIFQTESGWQIPADRRKECFEELLTDLGFNEREIKDFTDFWTEKLIQGTDYIMYPQGTELVDLAMPVTITEKPESLERIWFVFIRDDGRRVEEPQGNELNRGGESCSYYVIEWGGLILPDES
ncbi:MAG: hypothetical protein KH452_11715 [Clostridiales bacterium]|nr:hypothetical protein [Clostridiales bacterium]